MERWAKGPTGDAGRPPGALGAAVGPALQQMLNQVQEHSDERGAAVEAKFPDIHKAAGPFGIVLTAEGVISVLSNGELRELAENAGIRAEEEGSATTAIINGKVWMHFPVNEQAEQDQEGGGICRTMAACLIAYKEPMCAALRHKLLTNPSLQRIILVVADLLPCVFPPKSGLNHQFLQRYYKEVLPICVQQLCQPPLFPGCDHLVATLEGAHMILKHAERAGMKIQSIGDADSGAGCLERAFVLVAGTLNEDPQSSTKIRITFHHSNAACAEFWRQLAFRRSQYLVLCPDAMVCVDWDEMTLLVDGNPDGWLKGRRDRDAIRRGGNPLELYALAFHTKALELAAFAPLMPIADKLKNKDLEGALAVVMSSAAVLKATSKFDPEMPRNVLKKVLQSTGFQSALHQMASKPPVNLQSPLQALQSLSQDLEGDTDEMMEKLQGVMMECKEAFAEHKDIQFPQDLIKSVDPISILAMIGEKMPGPLKTAYSKALEVAASALKQGPRGAEWTLEEDLAVMQELKRIRHGVLSHKNMTEYEAGKIQHVLKVCCEQHRTVNAIRLRWHDKLKKRQTQLASSSAEAAACLEVPPLRCRVPHERSRNCVELIPCPHPSFEKCTNSQTGSWGWMLREV
eukprot:Tamp_07142.p1 GENE.Tamp_07142~~Tamp_07142.p1  ORF type:complete len:715 (+),score=161.30 Tamp_07142:261-2147(+)